MENQDTHLEILETETKKQTGQREFYQPAKNSIIDEIANEINDRPFYCLAYANFMIAISRFADLVWSNTIFSCSKFKTQ